MKITAQWNAKRGAFDVKANRRLVAFVDLLLIRDATAKALKDGQRVFSGELEAFQGETLPAMSGGYRNGLWTRCDAAYRAYGRKTGTPPKDDSLAPMVLCERIGGKPFAFAFDPCLSPVAFPED